MNIRSIKTLAALLFFISGPVFAADFYVITGTYKMQKEAQQVAAIKGGWVLNTNFYDQLTPNRFAVVRGPFTTKKTADQNLAMLMEGGGYRGSYVKNAETINIQVKIGDKALSPQMLAAIFGELKIDVTEHKGGSNPCEPQEPYKALSFSYVTIVRDYDEKKGTVLFHPRDVPVDIGAFREIKSTGEIDRMRICAE